MNNQIVRKVDSLDGSVASAHGRRAFPLRTLMICFTSWLIATEILIFDQARFKAKVELLDEAAHALRGPELIVPNEQVLNPSGSPKLEGL